AHRVEAGEVAARLARHDQVVGPERVVEVRAGDLDDLGTAVHEVLDGLVEARLHLWREAVTGELAHDADPHPGDVPVPRGPDDVRDRLVDRRRVARVVPGHDLVEERRVEDGAGTRTRLVERGGHRDEPVAGHRTV